MKKLTVISAIILILGAALFLSGYIMSGRDIGAMDIDTPLVHIDFTRSDAAPGADIAYPASDISGIVISATSTDVSLGRSPDSLVHVCCPSGAEAGLDPASGVLTVSQSPAGFHLFSIDLAGGGDIEVLLPGGLVPDLDVSTTAGDIYLEGVSLGDCGLHATSGDAYVSAARCESLRFGSTSGDACLEDVAASSVAISTTSGDALLDGVDAGESISVNTTSGEVSGALARPRADYSVSIITASGDTDLRSGGSGPVELRVSTTSGDIDLRFAK